MTLRTDPTQLIQIVPALPPRINGVGDHALALARCLGDNYNIQTHFIVGDPNWTGQDRIDGFRVTLVAARSPEALFTALQMTKHSAPAIMLQLSPYGYDRNGCPAWLCSGLKLYRLQRGPRPLITFFHELFATSAPWRKAFWYSASQRRIARRLLGLSTRAFTNTSHYAEALRAWHCPCPVDVAPVFSSVGEPDQTSRLDLRAKRLVIFGQLANRVQTLEDRGGALARTCRLFDINQICVIGPNKIHVPNSNVTTKVAQLGPLSATEIGALLQDATAGFLSYPGHLLGKSAVFAAYCSHRVVPVNTSWALQAADGLIASKHYWVPHLARTASAFALQNIADNAHMWYGGHTLAQHAKIIAQSLLDARTI